MIKSPIRYAGGKGWLAEQLVKEIHDANPRRYIEPFVGGGAIAINIKPTIMKYLGDTNAIVIDMWRCIRSAPDALIKELDRVEHDYPNTNEGYLKARQELNSMITSTRPIWIRRSAVFLYINARCFNGLWRVDQKRGFYNVPYGKIKKPASIVLDEAKALQRALLSAQLFDADFSKLLQVGRDMTGAAIYADPPYDGTYDGYSKTGFGEESQRALAMTLRTCAASGARVWATNADTPLVREIYSWAEITAIHEQHNVGATAERRGKKPCVLIRG